MNTYNEKVCNNMNTQEEDVITVLNNTKNYLPMKISLADNVYRSPGGLSQSGVCRCIQILGLQGWCFVYVVMGT